MNPNPRSICFNCGKLLCNHVNDRFCHPNWKMDVFSDRPSSVQIVEYLKQHEPAMLSDIITALKRSKGHEL